MKKGEIVSVVTVSGEYVGALETLDPLTISNPRMIVSTGEGKMGFAKGIALTGKENPDTQVFNQYVFVAETNSNVAEAHAKAISIIETAGPTVTKLITN